MLLSYTSKLADSDPTSDGVKYAVKVHNAPGASDPLHGGSPRLVVKSLLFGPVIVQAVNPMVEVPTFAIVTDVDTWCPTVELRVTGFGVNSTPVAVPDSGTVCGLVESESDTLSVPVGKPTVVGVNCR